MPDRPTFMYVGIPAEIRIQCVARDIHTLKLLAQRFVQLKTSPVIREVQQPALAQDLHRRMNQLRVISLHVEGFLHATGIGERRWIQQHQVVALVLLLQPITPKW